MIWGFDLRNLRNRNTFNVFGLKITEILTIILNIFFLRKNIIIISGDAHIEVCLTFSIIIRQKRMKNCVTLI